MLPRACPGVRGTPLLSMRNSHPDALCSPLGQYFSISLACRQYCACVCPVNLHITVVPADYLGGSSQELRGRRGQEPDDDSETRRHLGILTMLFAYASLFG